MLVQTREQFEQVRSVVAVADRVTVDTETTGLHPHTGDRLCGIAIRCPIRGLVLNNQQMVLEAYLPFRHRPGDDLFTISENLPLEWLPEFLRVLNKPQGRLRFHNAKFDLTMLAYEGFDFHNNPFECTQIMSWLNCEWESHRLKDLHDKYIPNSQSKARESTVKEWVKKEGSYDRVPPSAMEPYACGDVRDTDDIYDFLANNLEAQGLTPLLEREFQFARLLFDMEQVGIGVDLELCESLSEQVVARMRLLEDEMGFDPLKNAELARRLFLAPPVGLGLPYPESLTRTPSPDFPNGIPELRKDWLAQHKSLPLVASVMEYKALVKARSTWYAGFQEHAGQTVDSRLHTTFNGSSGGKSKMGIQGKSGTVTGRLNSSFPNVHQIPRQDEEVETELHRQVKKVFLPGRQRWSLFEFDYSQIEVRLSCPFGNATVMMEALKAGLDPHRATAERIGCNRQTAKHATYTTLYGGSARTLARTIERLEFLTTGNVITYDEFQAQQILNDYFELYPGYRLVMRKASNLMKTRGYVQMWNGRKRHYEQWYDAKLGKTVDNTHKAFNSLIQGGAAEIIKQSMLSIPWREKQHAYRLVNQVHDSLWIEINRDFQEDWIKEIVWYMEWPSREERFAVPFPVDVKLMRHEPFDIKAFANSPEERIELINEYASVGG